MRGLLVALALAGCGTQSAPKPVTPPASDNGSGSGAPGGEAEVRCRLTVAEQQVELLELRSDDGTCRLYLPGAVAAGALPLRVGAGSGEQTAILEARVGTETFYASEGSATVVAVEGGRVRGRASGRDTNPPGTARFTVAFDATRSAP